MAGLATDEQGALVRCGACGQKNRISWSHVGEIGRCGKCEAELSPIGEPLELGSEAAFQGLVAASPLPVLVDFWAAWCGPCVMVAPEITKVAATAAGRLVVAKVDTEALPGLSQRLRVTSIPTLTVYAGGREIGRTMGARPAAGILAFVQETLAETPRRG